MNPEYFLNRLLRSKVARLLTNTKVKVGLLFTSVVIMVLFHSYDIPHFREPKYFVFSFYTLFLIFAFLLIPYLHKKINDRRIKCEGIIVDVEDNPDPEKETKATVEFEVMGKKYRIVESVPIYPKKGSKITILINEENLLKSSSRYLSWEDMFFCIIIFIFIEVFLIFYAFTDVLKLP